MNSAAQLSQATDEETLQFASGLFSKYVIVSAPEGSGGKCGENLTWKMDADGNLTISGTGAMYCYPESAALAYAKANSIPYVVIGEEDTDTPAPTATPTATPTAVPTTVPKTGDASSPALWIGLVLLGVLGVGATVVLRRRK